ncbi:DUF2934 domain-containing protein [Methylogaea oryzae]|uniref:DUF2934 domain-containing protein n=1 Tax=Methylogaea oryzae TaxID=1295382 RepID=A0A8D4VQF8_9GAMM|nr:DUF2934 domain-containing protein [Methylogaea oryzae]BBL72168.1 hypothetical protein MoryE10_27740 [Methylogaea oryzae]
MNEPKSKPATRRPASANKKSAGDAVPKTKAAAAPKRAAAKKPAAPAGAHVSPEERYKMTEVAAYYIAQRDGFAGDAKAYWAEAERQIDNLLAKP